MDPGPEGAPDDAPPVEVADDGTSTLEPDAPRRLPPWARSWLVRIAPGADLAYDAAAWEDALVVLAEGRVELVCVTGRRYPIDAVGVLWLEGLTLRALHNPATDDAVILAVARRTCPRIT